MKSLVIATHDGTFHADDVFAAATLSLAYPDQELEIMRTRDEAKIATADVVIDVGGVYDPSTFRFDHHQKEGAGVRYNNIPFASFGLVWNTYGVTLAGSPENAQFIDEKLVQAIDAHDNGLTSASSENGVHPYSIGEALSTFRPTWEEGRSNDEAFLQAVTVALSVLTRIIAHTKSYAKSVGFIEEAYRMAPDKRVIKLERDYPGWKEILSSYPEPLYVLYQREDENWSAKAVPIDPTSFTVRKPFPESWAGLRDRELKKVTGVPGASFCHNGRFIVVAKSYTGALQLINIALQS